MLCKPHLEPKMSGEASALVVSTNEVHAVRMCHLQRKKVEKNLARKFSAVDIVSQEQVAVFLGFQRGVCARGTRWGQHPTYLNGLRKNTQ